MMWNRRLPLSIFDFHCHILPGIDDGSRDIRMTEQMLHMEISQGVDHILFTPHFYAQHQSASEFIRMRQDAYDRTSELIEEAGMPLVTRYAAETYYFKGISEAGILDDLCMHTEGQNVLLLEMPFDQWRKEVYEEVKALVEKRDLTVVIVHIERFIEFQKDRSIWDKVFDLPVIPQHNSGIFTKLSKRGTGLRTLKDGWPVILGTDAHNTDTRHPNMDEGRAVIEKKLGPSVLREIDDRSRQLWENGMID